ncbi:MAG TPA: SIS domain-containing protein, partial [Polyangiaceae bacterium]|nr:SIS domain-containing protein [Polyangiaceae bacterium]
IGRCVVKVLSDLRASIGRKSAESADVQRDFFARSADDIVACSQAMARTFDAGAHLYAMGNGGSACDAQHLAVEFAHPVLGKRPALPATALSSDATLLTAIGNDDDFAVVFAKQVRLLGKKGDIAFAISTSGRSTNVLRGLAAAREIGMLTVGLTGNDGGRMSGVCDHCFVVPSFSIHRIQETHLALIHVLWDLVHVVRGQEDVL